MNTITKTQYNLSAYFILPLLKLNINSYGKDNFINSFVTKGDDKQVVVYIKNSSQAKDYYSHEYMIADVEEDDYTMIVYKLPEEWKEDYDFFVDSKYSKMSSFAKDQIKLHAKANEKMFDYKTGKKIKIEGRLEDEIVSARIYHGLTKSSYLKSLIEEELDVKLGHDTELLAKLEEKEFIEL